MNMIVTRHGTPFSLQFIPFKINPRTRHTALFLKRECCFYIYEINRLQIIKILIILRAFMDGFYLLKHHL